MFYEIKQRLTLKLQGKSSDSCKKLDSRMVGFDTVKAIAVLAVVIIHAPIEIQPFPEASFIGEILRVLSRFAVPFFLITSGYFLRRSFKPGKRIEPLFASRIYRLASIFLFWSILFSLIPYDWNTSLRNLGLGGMISAQLQRQVELAIAQPQLLILRGTGHHLWFLSALLFSMVILLGFVQLRLEKALLPFSLVLYGWAVLGGAYSNTPIGISTLGVGYLSPLVSTLFVSIGWQLGSHQKAICSPKQAYQVLGLGFGLHLLEARLAASVWNVNFTDGYFFSTPLFGLGAFLVAWSQPDLGVRFPVMAQIGRYSLGIYAVHPLLLGLCHGLTNRLGEPFTNLHFIPTFVLSILIIYWLAKVRFLKPFVA